MSPPAPVAIIEGFPLVWLVSPRPRLLATLTPVYAEAAGEDLVLRGHLPRQHPHVAALRGHPEAVILALGPQAYISPSWLDDRTQAPSWNYAAARFDVTIGLLDEPSATAAVLREQVRRLEDGRADAWSVDEMGPRFDRLAAHVVAFEAVVSVVDPRFKLGQADREDVLAQSLAALSGDPIHAWMAAYNADRLT